MADLARRLELTLCAEGIETAKALEMLCGLKFDLGQGFLFGKPMPAEDFLEPILGKSSAHPKKGGR